MLRWAINRATSLAPPSDRYPKPHDAPAQTSAPPLTSDCHLASPTLTLPPAPVASHQQVVRAAIVGAANECMGSAKANSTTRVYNSILDKIVPSAESGSGMRLLPCESDEQFIVLFSHVLLSFSSGLGPLNADGEKSIRWSYVRSARAALAAWHESRGMPSILDSWAPRMRSFWAGLKRRAVHTVANKEPMSIDTVREILYAGASAWYTIESEAFLTFSNAKAFLIDLRTAASVAIAFFGIRRAAEVSNIVLDDVVWDKAANSMVIRVRQQKNDQLGQGQDAVIPAFPLWGTACPVATLQHWLQARAMIASKWNDRGRIQSSEPAARTSSSARPWFLLALSGPSWGGRLSPDALRESIKRKCAHDAPCPSPRKGGVRFFRALGVDRRIIQVQGGWKSDAVMDSIYDGFGHHEVVAAVSGAARSAQLIDSACVTLQQWDTLGDLSPRKLSSCDQLAMIAKLSSALPTITSSLLFKHGPRARANVSHALRHWEVSKQAQSNLSKALIHLRAVERKGLDFEACVDSSVALSADLRRNKRPRSPDSDSALE